MKCWGLKLSITLGRASSLYSLRVAVKRPANLTSRSTALPEISPPSSANLPGPVALGVCIGITPLQKSLSRLTDPVASGSRPPEESWPIIIPTASSLLGAPTNRCKLAAEGPIERRLRPSCFTAEFRGLQTAAPRVSRLKFCRNGRSRLDSSCRGGVRSSCTVSM